MKLNKSKTQSTSPTFNNFLCFCKPTVDAPELFPSNWEGRNGFTTVGPNMSNRVFSLSPGSSSS